MSRFTVTILLACVLLGILLWIVLSTVAELANPQPLITLEEESAVVEFDPQLPVIKTAIALQDWLDKQQLEGANLIADFQNWRAARGYPLNSSWLGTNRDDQDTFADDNANLVALAGSGNIRAAAALAERSMQNSPVEALEWWDQAIINGSLYAMLRMSDLLNSLGDPSLNEFRSDSVWQQALDEINAQTLSPRERALAWSIAAVTVGGFAIVDSEHVNRIEALVNQLDESQINNACEAAQEYVLETAMARRAQGGAVFSTDRPLFATGVADPESIIPCDIPVPPLIVLNDCLTQPFVGPGDRLWQAWFCPSP
jgi:hypothetical protein